LFVLPEYPQLGWDMPPPLPFDGNMNNDEAFNENAPQNQPQQPAGSDQLSEVSSASLSVNGLNFQVLPAVVQINAIRVQEAAEVDPGFRGFHAEKDFLLLDCLLTPKVDVSAKQRQSAPLKRMWDFAFSPASLLVKKATSALGVFRTKHQVTKSSSHEFCCC
jgi:hypothetical protein